MLLVYLPTCPAYMPYITYPTLPIFFTSRFRWPQHRTPQIYLIHLIVYLVYLLFMVTSEPCFTVPRDITCVQHTYSHRPSRLSSSCALVLLEPLTNKRLLLFPPLLPPPPCI
ncbi:hypothetical protein F5Y10DRAFT_9052 [Nemania abortiva]|nr:hypothetical protein F5Y10DRAFT_9052 [Nemania abortiva]